MERRATMERGAQVCARGLPRLWGSWTFVGTMKLERGPERPFRDQFMRKLEGRVAVKTVCPGQVSP